MQVLIVDSSIQIIERLEEIISEVENITAIDRAVSYQEAKKLYNENNHDAVVLDIDLLRNESFELLKEIRKTNDKTFVIILSSSINNFLEKECKTLGAYFFFDKYYEFEKICDAFNGIGC